MTASGLWQGAGREPAEAIGRTRVALGTLRANRAVEQARHDAATRAREQRAQRLRDIAWESRARQHEGRGADDAAGDER